MSLPSSESPSRPPHVVIVGGGVAGLAAAWELEPWSRSGQLSVDLYEASSRFGGPIVSDRASGFVLEGGPDSFLTRKPEALALCEELGLSASLIGFRRSAQGAYIFRAGRLHRIPPLFGVSPWSAARSVLSTSLLSRVGKVRAAIGVGAVRLRPIRTDDRIALGPQLRSRFGNEAVDWLLEPFVAGVHPAPLEVLSPAAVATVLPSRWVAGVHPPTPTSSGSRAAAAKPDRSGRRPGPFASLRDGMERLPLAIVEQVRGAELHVGQPVDEVRPEGDRYGVVLSGGTTVLADGVILAVSTDAAARILSRGLPDVGEELRGIRMSDLIVAGLVFDRKDIPMTLDGAGVLVPTRSGLPISAITWLSAKWDRPDPDPERVALRVFLRNDITNSGSSSPGPSLERVRRGLREVMGITAAPRYAVVFPHRASMPWYELGHDGRVAEIRQKLRDWPRVELAGSPYDGIGIPDAVRSGREAARRILAHPPTQARHLDQPRLRTIDPAPAGTLRAPP